MDRGPSAVTDGGEKAPKGGLLRESICVQGAEHVFRPKGSQPSRARAARDGQPDGAPGWRSSHGFARSWPVPRAHGAAGRCGRVPARRCAARSGSNRAAQRQRQRRRRRCRAAQPRARRPGGARAAPGRLDASRRRPAGGWRACRRGRCRVATGAKMPRPTARATSSAAPPREPSGRSTTRASLPPSRSSASTPCRMTRPGGGARRAARPARRKRQRQRPVQWSRAHGLPRPAPCASSTRRSEPPLPRSHSRRPQAARAPQWLLSRPRPAAQLATRSRRS